MNIPRVFSCFGSGEKTDYIWDLARLSWGGGRIIYRCKPRTIPRSLAEALIFAPYFLLPALEVKLLISLLGLSYTHQLQYLTVGYR
jgi:hypothetical protein